MFEGLSWRRGLRPITICTVLALLGCGSEEADNQSDGQAGEPATSIEVPTAESESPVSSAVASEPSPDELAAREAFRTMTAEGVSQEEVDSTAQKIQELGPAALPVLAEGLKSEEPIKREQAATMLALIGSDASEVSDALVDALDDNSEFVRFNAATALAQMEGQASHVIPVYGEFLESEDTNLRMMAAMNLGVLEPAAAKPLIGQLIATLDTDDPMILRPVVELLGKIGPDANSALEKIGELDTSDDAELETAVNVAKMQIEAKADQD